MQRRLEGDWDKTKEQYQHQWHSWIRGRNQCGLTPASWWMLWGPAKLVLTAEQEYRGLRWQDLQLQGHSGSRGTWELHYVTRRDRQHLLPKCSKHESIPTSRKVPWVGGYNGSRNSASWYWGDERNVLLSDLGGSERYEPSQGRVNLVCGIKMCVKMTKGDTQYT